jgi:hypothetical protein
MSESVLYVCKVDTPEGVKEYVTLLPPDLAFSRGLAPEAIVGVLSHTLGAEERITPEIFARNPIFVQFLHETLARHAPNQPSFRAEARRLGNGWVYIIDGRTRTPGGAVPPEDIIGSLEVKQGEVVPESYRASPKHRILSRDGFFRLDPELHRCLLEELAARRSSPGDELPR